MHTDVAMPRAISKAIVRYFGAILGEGMPSWREHETQGTTSIDLELTDGTTASYVCVASGDPTGFIATSDATRRSTRR